MKLSDYRHQERVRDQLSLEAANDTDGELAVEAESQNVVEDTNRALSVVRAKTGKDLSSAEVKDLEGNTAGLYYVGQGRVELDRALIERAGDVMTKVHVALHEANHWVFDEKRNGERIDTGFEEGLNEKLTQRTTGKTLAYDSEQSMVDDVARKTNQSVATLVDQFESGDSKNLNIAWTVYEQAA